MKELYRKGLANHSGPESCGILREKSTEALTGEDAVRVIELRNQQFVGADYVGVFGKATSEEALGRVSEGPAAVKERGTQGNLMRENREGSLTAQHRKGDMPQIKCYRRA